MVLSLNNWIPVVTPVLLCQPLRLYRGPGQVLQPLRKDQDYSHTATSSRRYHAGLGILSLHSVLHTWYRVYLLHTMHFSQVLQRDFNNRYNRLPSYKFITWTDTTTVNCYHDLQLLQADRHQLQWTGSLPPVTGCTFQHFEYSIAYSE